MLRGQIRQVHHLGARILRITQSTSAQFTYKNKCQAVCELMKLYRDQYAAREDTVDDSQRFVQVDWTIHKAWLPRDLKAYLFPGEQDDDQPEATED